MISIEELKNKYENDDDVLFLIETIQKNQKLNSLYGQQAKQEYCETDSINITKEQFKKDIVKEMIMNLLFNSLVLNSKNKTLKLDYYKIDEDTMTYLLKNYDEERFNLLHEMKKNLSDED